MLYSLLLQTGPSTASNSPHSYKTPTTSQQQNRGDHLQFTGPVAGSGGQLRSNSLSALMSLFPATGPWCIRALQSPMKSTYSYNDPLRSRYPSGARTYPYHTRGEDTPVSVDSGYLQASLHSQRDMPA